MELTSEERKKKRPEPEKPVLDTIFAWSKIEKRRTNSKLDIALKYLKNQWPT